MADSKDARRGSRGVVEFCEVRCSDYPCECMDKKNGKAFDPKREAIEYWTAEDEDELVGGKSVQEQYKAFGNNEVKVAEESSKPSDLTVRITADMGDAITGFKSLQRELRETTRAARELEAAYLDVEKAFNKRGDSNSK